MGGIVRVIFRDGKSWEVLGNRSAPGEAVLGARLVEL